MAYIGKTPTIGNFQVCDAISVVNNQAAYTMQVGGVNVSPESANHMLVSLNGILQAPTSSFTVSGSTITFASNLVTGDVIDFIQILGNVLDLGVPSDGTVSTAKIVDSAVTSAKIADSNVTTAKIADANVTLAKLSATGTKDATTFLRGDNTFAEAGGGDFVKLASTTQTTGDAINSLSLDGYFDDDTYSAYEVYISDYNSGTSDSAFGFRVLVGNSVDTGSNYYWHMHGYSEALGSTSQTLFREYGMPNTFPEIFRSMDNGDNANYRGSAKITIYNPESSGYKWIHMRNHHIYNNGTEYVYWNNLTDIYYRQTSVLTGVNFSTSGGQNFGGTFALYGLKK